MYAQYNSAPKSDDRQRSTLRASINLFYAASTLFELQHFCVGSCRHGQLTNDVTLNYESDCLPFIIDICDAHANRYHGEGQLLLASGFQYSGTFFDGLPHVLGTAVYPGGSTFRGPFKEGLKNGSGGKYVCGITGICWTGEWVVGEATGVPSKWAIEADSADKHFGAGGSGVDRAKNEKPGAKEEKSGGGKKGGRASKKAAEEPAGDDVEKPVIAHFSSDGAVAGLWCRSVRNVEVCCSERNARLSQLIV